MHDSVGLERVEEAPLDFSAMDAVADAPVRTFRYRNRPNDSNVYIGPLVEECGFLADRADPENALGVDLHSLVGVLWAACNELFNDMGPLKSAADALPQIVSQSNHEHEAIRAMAAEEAEAARAWAADQIAAEVSSRVAAQSAMTQAMTAAMTVGMADERALRERADTAEATTRADAVAAETTARKAAVTSEAAARTAAVDGEAASRQAAVAGEAKARTDADALEVAARQNAITTEAAARQAADDSEASARAAAVSAEAKARQDADTAEAATRKAADDAEAQARVTLAGRVTALETALATAVARVSVLEARKVAMWRAVGNLPALAVNATVDITCPWVTAPTVAPDVSATVVILSPTLGSTTAVVKSCSTTGAVVTVKAGLALTASAGAIQVVAATIG